MTEDLRAQLWEGQASEDGLLRLVVDHAQGQLAVTQASLEDLKVKEAISLESGHCAASDLQVLRSHQERLEAASSVVYSCDSQCTWFPYSGMPLILCCAHTAVFPSMASPC
jgi:hypothetical protein